MPSACEVDVTGTVAMYALQLASGTPSALVDWNNNYGDDPRQVRVLPLRQLGQDLPARHHDRHRTDPGHHAGRGEHLRRARRPHARGPVTFGRVIHRRPRRVHPRLRRRRPAHRRPAATPSARAPSSHVPQLQTVDALHLPAWVRASRGDECVALRRHPGRGDGDLSGLGGPPALLTLRPDKGFEL